jgi:hypothetical protein
MLLQKRVSSHYFKRRELKLQVGGKLPEQEEEKLDVLIINSK